MDIEWKFFCKLSETRYIGVESARKDCVWLKDSYDSEKCNGCAFKPVEAKHRKLRLGEFRQELIKLSYRLPAELQKPFVPSSKCLLQMFEKKTIVSEPRVRYAPYKIDSRSGSGYVDTDWDIRTDAGFAKVLGIDEREVRRSNPPHRHWNHAKWGKSKEVLEWFKVNHGSGP